MASSPSLCVAGGGVKGVREGCRKIERGERERPCLHLSMFVIHSAVNMFKTSVMSVVIVFTIRD